MPSLSTFIDLPSAELARLVLQIGNTPLQPVHFQIGGRTRTVHLKLEGANPTGSMKDRTGYGLIQNLEERLLLHPGSTLVESTSGNLGVALALLCKARAYKFIAVIDPKTTQENIAKMKLLGAQVELVSQPDIHGGYLLSRLERVHELCAQNEDYVWSNQYANIANPQIHYLTTGPEVYQQMQGKIDAVFVPVSTGGTLTGIGSYLRKVSPATRIIGVDAFGSIVFGQTSASRKLTGIGSSRASSFITREIYDDYVLVQDEEAFAFCHALQKRAGLKLGGSSGCVLFACAQYLAQHSKAERVVCICADGGENYEQTIYNDTWLQKLSPELFAQQMHRDLEIVLSE